MPDINYNLKSVRAAAILTESYVAGTVIKDCERSNKLRVFAKFVKGSLTSFQLKLEFSDDGVTYYQQTFEAVSGAVATCTPGYFTFAPSENQNYVIDIPIKCSRVKVWAKGTGTVTGSSLQLRATIGAE